jgi:hypothetical protein
MAQVRYAVVFGIKDAADRFLPQGEIYLRNTDLEQAKSIFKSLPTSGAGGEHVVRIYERYYDKHLDPDMDYQKTEFTIECSESGLDAILHSLMNRDN